ncbi:uncharacterized protein LOC125112108 [Phacochoerus africanus]|uniref:uncharacterized protein LOC125112108 n=1 Tax=Phacochoerus africanus TaxID=41426 RepID=UPI001FD9F095|nr:uncharacterized protein LOC125112108 [Phacochoerus africanus]
MLSRQRPFYHFVFLFIRVIQGGSIHDPLFTEGISGDGGSKEPKVCCWKVTKLGFKPRSHLMSRFGHPDMLQTALLACVRKMRASFGNKEVEKHTSEGLGDSLCPLDPVQNAPLLEAFLRNQPAHLRLLRFSGSLFWLLLAPSLCSHVHHPRASPGSNLRAALSLIILLHPSFPARWSPQDRLAFELDLGGSGPAGLQGAGFGSVTTLAWPVLQHFLLTASHVKYQFKLIEGRAALCL